MKNTTYCCKTLDIYISIRFVKRHNLTIMHIKEIISNLE